MNPADKGNEDENFKRGALILLALFYLQRPNAEGQPLLRSRATEPCCCPRGSLIQNHAQAVYHLSMQRVSACS